MEIFDSNILNFLACLRLRINMNCAQIIFKQSSVIEPAYYFFPNNTYANRLCLWTLGVLHPPLCRYILHLTSIVKSSQQ